METPALLRGQGTANFDKVPSAHQNDRVEIFYATDRASTTSEDGLEYTGQRGRNLVLGIAKVEIGQGLLSWPSLVRESLAEARTAALPMKVVSREEVGTLKESIFFLDPAFAREENEAEEAAFASRMNARLETSRSQDVYVFVSPFKHSFDDSAVVAAEFFHFMGRDGAFMVYSWPSERSNLSYFQATENAYFTVRSLRELIRFLADRTDAREIHLMTYSAGARVLSYALHGLRLQSDALDEVTVREKFRIGQVIYTGPDLDSDVFRNQYQDGTADLADQITIYTTGKDRALRTARFVFGGDRLGATQAKNLRAATIDHLRKEEQTNFVIVSNTERIDKDNSHGYYRESPWVSSDILLQLACSLSPADRGLVRGDDEAFWRFPENYAEEIGALAKERCPTF